MKVIQLITRSDTIGGGQKHVLDLAVALRKNQHDVIVVSGPRGPFTDMLETHEIPTINIKSFSNSTSILNIANDFRAAFELREIIKNEAPDVLACHSSKAGLVGRIVAKLSGIPSIYTMHGLSFNPNINLTRRVLAWILEMIGRPFSDQVIAVSEYDGNLAISAMVASSARLHIIPNSVEQPAAVSAKKNCSVKQLLMPARLDNQKDHELLFRALARLKTLPWELHLLGDGPLESALKKSVGDLGIQDKVHFVGLVPDVQPFYNQADVMVLTSHYEGLPLSILEAMTFGLPVIASNVGGVCEAVIHEKNGYLIEPGDENALTVALNSLITNSALSDEMGQASLAHYTQRFKYGDFLDSTLSLYSRTVKV